jgi:hypothetical protein
MLLYEASGGADPDTLDFTTPAMELVKIISPDFCAI